MTTESEWWTTPEWRRARRDCLNRDGNCCQRCSKHHPRGAHLTAHHIIPRIESGGDNVENLITLCTSCHNKVEGLGLRSVSAIIGYSGEPSEETFPEKPWHPLVYGCGTIDPVVLINQVCHLLDENTELADELRKTKEAIDELTEMLAELTNEIRLNEAIELKRQKVRKNYERFTLTDEEKAIGERVLALYGKPGFETWEKIGKLFRMSRGSAWSLAHGRKKPDGRTLERLESAEWRLHHLEQATANIMGLIGKKPVQPTVFRRAKNR
jgi:hypothetical protein